MPSLVFDDLGCAMIHSPWRGGREGGRERGREGGRERGRERGREGGREGGSGGKGVGEYKCLQTATKTQGEVQLN